MEVEIDEQRNAQPQQPQGKICYGDCFSCSMAQAIMCGSKNTLTTMRLVERLEGEIAQLSDKLAELQAVIGSREDLIDPDEKK